MSRWRKSCPFIGPEHSNQGMKEEDKGSSKFLNFACGTEPVQPGRLGRKHASLACLVGMLPTSFADLSQLHNRQVSYKNSTGMLPASWFAHAAFAHRWYLPQGKNAGMYCCTDLCSSQTCLALCQQSGGQMIGR